MMWFGSWVTAAVAAGRARDRTVIFADRKLIDESIRAEQPLSQRTAMAEPDDNTRIAWLASRLSRSAVKGDTLVIVFP